jgi:hypothetical protein
VADQQPGRALEILEQERAVFWAHALRLRSQFNVVPTDIRQELLKLSRLLEQNDTVTRVSSNPQIIEKAAAQRQAK